MKMSALQRRDAPDVLARKLADEAARVVGSITETHYTHELHINASAGVYDVDCSGFVSYLLQRVASRHYRMIASASVGYRPLARDYYAFAAALASSIQHGWRQVIRLAEAMPGDIMAWQLHDPSTHDTGHVFVIAKAPTALADQTFLIRVYDSSSIHHFGDTRGHGPGLFANGVGAGGIEFRTDANGAPTDFQFNRTAHQHSAPIAIARLEPFSAG